MAEATVLFQRTVLVELKRDWKSRNGVGDVWSPDEREPSNVPSKSANVTNERRYQELRRKGMATQRAARIADSSFRKKVARSLALEESEIGRERPPDTPPAAWAGRRQPRGASDVAAPPGAG
jgi:hypothetical protein